MAPFHFELDWWIRRIAQGDRDALEKLYQATRPAVYAYALSLTKDPHCAEDVLQDCYITIWNSAGGYQPQGKAMAWIMTITRNLCYKRLQQQKRYLPLDCDDYLGRSDADPDERLLVRQCLKALTEEEQQIVILHAVAGCRHQEIAQMLGLKTGTVLSKYHRAIQKLRDALQ